MPIRLGDTYQLCSAGKIDYYFLLHTFYKHKHSVTTPDFGLIRFLVYTLVYTNTAERSVYNEQSSYLI